MTIPSGKNWPEVQTIDGSVSLVPGGAISVQNPIGGMFPPILIPLQVLVTNPGGPVTPAIPNFPSVNRFAEDLPSDGSPLELVLYKGGAQAPQYSFRDVAAAGDVREFCGGSLPPMRIYWSKPKNVVAEVVLTFTETIRVNGIVVYEVAIPYSTPAFDDFGMIELTGTIHVPSYAAGTIDHQLRLEGYVNGGHAEPTFDVEVMLCSHYDVVGGPPA